MELRHLRYFIAVAEELNFTRAAARLGLSQPPLSQQIGKLERELGAPVFIRTARGVQLTEAGQVLLDEARILLDRSDETIRLVKRAARGESGAVRIGSVPSGFSGVLLDLLPRYRSSGEVALPLVYEAEAEALIESLDHGTLDIAFLRTTRDYPGLKVHQLADEPLVALLPSEHRLARRRRIDLGQLSDDTMIMFHRGAAPEAFDAITMACHAAGFTPEVTYEAPNDHALVSLVAAGLGVSVVPESTTNLHIPGASYRQLAEPAWAAPMAAVLPDHATPAARRVLATPVQRLR